MKKEEKNGPRTRTKNPMPHQDPSRRIRNFSEVALGYDEETAVAEALRCLNCRQPCCVSGCPVEVDIPAFLQKIVKRDFAAAAAIIKEKNSLPAICGRVCPQEDQCERCCVLGRKGEPVAIGRLERFAADWESLHALSAETASIKSAASSYRAAVVGSGPAGLTAAADLARMGYRVTIFEAFHRAGGVLTYGIPEFRLPKSIVEGEIEYIKGLGVEIKLDHVIGRILDVDELLEKEGFHAVFISVGAGLPRLLNIPGENLLGVTTANELLTRTNLMKAYLFPQTGTPVKVEKRAVVIGGGNVAMDAARTLRRLGAEEVTVLYRRTREEMPARAEEIIHAEEEGIAFRFLSIPLAIHGDERRRVTGLECVQAELGPPDESGRRRPIPVEGSNFLIETEMVVTALGSGANPLLTSTLPDVKRNKRGFIEVDPETGQTSKVGVFAGGDIVTGSATVISAMAAGKRAARAIDIYLKSMREQSV